MNTLSILYAHLWYENIEFYVDNKTYQYVNHLPIKVFLMNFRDNSVWVDAKMQVIEEQYAPFIHVDGDVFLTKPMPAFSRFQSDLLFERKECSFITNYKKQVIFFDQYFDGIITHWNPEIEYSYNCGVFGINDISIKDDFIKNYKLMKSIYIDNKVEFDYYCPDYEPCIVIEQYNMTLLAEKRGTIPTFILNENDYALQNIEAEKLGYIHYFGKSKYLNSDKIEKRLKLAFPYWHQKLMEKIACTNSLTL
jgi:hypothetical protein